MKIYLLLAEGFETIEALTPIDIFRRAGTDIESVSITGSLSVTSSQGIEVKADVLWENINFDDGDALILPGGYPGYENLNSHPEVATVVKDYVTTGRTVGAICGAPTIFARNGIGKGRRMTCHTTTLDEMTGYVMTGRDVEQDQNIITAIGAGHSTEFALALLYALQGDRKVAMVKKGLELK